MKIIEHKIKKVEAWALYCMETIGGRAGQYFLVDVGSYRADAQRARDRVKASHPGWKLKMKRVLVTPL